MTKSLKNLEASIKTLDAQKMTAVKGGTGTAKAAVVIDDVAGF